MKTKFILSAALALGLFSHVKANDEYNEKEEMKRTAEEFRKCAAENKSAKLDECDAEAPENLKKIAMKGIENRHKIGEIEEQLAAAYEAGDKKLIQKLHDKKGEAEMDYELLEKEKRAQYTINHVDELLKEYPDSAEAKELKAKSEADAKAYIENTKKMIEIQKEQNRLEKGMDSIYNTMEIIKKRAELKKLEEEAKE